MPNIRDYNGKITSIVAQLPEQLLPTPVALCSNSADSSI